MRNVHRLPGVLAAIAAVFVIRRSRRPQEAT
jgi:hypothetical protein